MGETNSWGSEIAYYKGLNVTSIAESIKEKLLFIYNEWIR